MSVLPVSRPIAISAAILAGAVVLALAAPAVMDGTAWRGRIEEKATALLGRKVTVAGPISLRLLPSPAVTLAAVGIENAASLDRVRLGLPLGALLAGRPELNDVAIEGGRLGPVDGLSLRATASGGAFTITGTGRLWGKEIRLDAKGQPPSGETSAPLKLSVALPALDGQAGFEGTFGKAGLDGKVEVSLSSLARASGSDQLPDAPLSAQAGLRLSTDELVISDLGIIAGESTITGSVVASLSGAPALMDITLRADSFDMDARRPAPSSGSAPVRAAPPSPISTSAPAPAMPARVPVPAQPFELPLNLAANLDLGIGRLIWRGQTVSNIQVNALLEGGRLTLSQASAKLPGAGAVRLTGALTTPEGRPRFDGSLKVESRNLPELRKWLSLGSGPSPTKGRLEGKVQLSESWLSLNALTLDLDQHRVTGMIRTGMASPLPLQAELGMTGMAFGFDGILVDGRLEGSSSLRAASFRQAVRAVSPGYNSRGNGELAVTTRMEAGAGRLAFEDFRAKAGDALLTGKGVLSLEGTPKLTANLSGNAIALDPFLPTEDTPESAKSRRRTGYATPPPAPVIPAALAAENTWSRAPLDLGWLQALDADLALEAQAITMSGWRLDHPKAHLGLSRGVADLDRLDGQLLGGSLAAAARLAPNAMTLSATLKGADLKGIKPASSGLRLEKGRLSGEIRLATAGTSSAALVSTLAGNGRVEVSDGEVSGFDLAAMDARMRHLENLGNLLGLVQAGLSGGSSRFSSLSGTFAADKGVITSRDLALVAEGGGATGTASIDLPRETITSKIAFKLATPDSPALGLRLEGKLAAPVKAVDINDLQRWMMEKGLGKALNPKGAGETSDAPKQKFKAGDALRGLFSAFGKKKD